MQRRKYDRHLIKWLSGGPRPAQQEEAHAHAALHAHWNARAHVLARKRPSLTKVLRSFSKASLQVSPVVETSPESKPPRR